MARKFINPRFRFFEERVVQGFMYQRLHGRLPETCFVLKLIDWMNMKTSKVMNQRLPSVDEVEWRHIRGSEHAAYRVDFEYSLLGYDISSGRLDMLLRYAPDFGHCRRHRHVASTMTLVLEGEQYLIEQAADGSERTISRKKGDYALAKADASPHLEHGGESGGVVLLSMVALDGILFEYFGEAPDDTWTVSVSEFVRDWNSGVSYGSKRH